MNARQVPALPAAPASPEIPLIPPLAQPVLAIHGGAGTLRRSSMSTAQADAYLDALHAVLQTGQAALAAGASALDVVVEAVRMLEECPLFNAGRGAVYTAAGTHELDACVMDGQDRRAGALAGLTTTRNPVLAAQALLQQGGPVMLAGSAADAFAAQQGLEQVAPEWFGTPQRLAQLHKAQQDQAGAQLDHDGKCGTVGAVALDAHGHLAAATSTGGMTNKTPGRIGDSPLIGAGCYADDATAAVSCTGTGEAFMRGLAAYDVAALMAYAGLSLQQAAERVVIDKLPLLDGRGGLIAVSASGELALPFNTEGMYRGHVRVGEAPVVEIYRQEQA